MRGCSKARQPGQIKWMVAEAVASGHIRNNLVSPALQPGVPGPCSQAPDVQPGGRPLGILPRWGTPAVSSTASRLGAKLVRPKRSGGLTGSWMK